MGTWSKNGPKMTQKSERYILCTHPTFVVCAKTGRKVAQNAQLASDNPTHKISSKNSKYFSRYENFSPPSAKNGRKSPNLGGACFGPHTMMLFKASSFSESRSCLLALLCLVRSACTSNGMSTMLGVSELCLVITFDRLFY